MDSSLLFRLLTRQTEFTNIWETAFNVIDPTFDCNVNRTKGDTSTQMYLINHYLDKLFLNVPVPNVDKANITNAATGFGSLGAQVDTCRTAHGRPPNFMLVDVRTFVSTKTFCYLQFPSSMNMVVDLSSKLLLISMACPTTLLRLLRHQ